MEYEERTRIATPEGVELELVLAGLASRFIAELFDALILGAVLVAMVILAALAGGGAGALILVVALGGFLLITVAYHVAFEVLARGRTPGKRWAGLRVVLEGGGPVDLRASLVRNLIRLIEGPPSSTSRRSSPCSPRAATSGSAISRRHARRSASRGRAAAACAPAPPAPWTAAYGRRLGRHRDHRRRSRRDPLLPRPPGAVHARVAPRPRPRPGRPARPEGRRPAARARPPRRCSRASPPRSPRDEILEVPVASDASAGSRRRARGSTTSPAPGPHSSSPPRSSPRTCRRRRTRARSSAARSLAVPQPGTWPSSCIATHTLARSAGRRSRGRAAR